MGLFGFGNNDRPEFDLSGINFRSAADIFGEGLGFGRKEFPLAMGARERGLGRIGELEPSPGFFEQFGPTSFEEALGAKGFEDIDRRIRQSLSLSGIESSPVLAEQRTRAGVDIGNVLAQLGQRRAEIALQGRQQGILAQLGIDPLQAIQPFTSTAQQQSNLQTQLGVQKRQADFQQALQDFQEKGALSSLLGTGGGAFLGAGLGGLLAAPTGGLSIPAGIGLGALGGAAAGGTFGSAFGGGGQAPFTFGQALEVGKAFQPNTTQDLINQLLKQQIKTGEVETVK